MLFKFSVSKPMGHPGNFGAFFHLYLEKFHCSFFSIRNFQHFPSHDSFGFVQKKIKLLWKGRKETIIFYNNKKIKTVSVCCVRKAIFTLCLAECVTSIFGESEGETWLAFHHIILLSVIKVIAVKTNAREIVFSNNEQDLDFFWVL